MINPETFECANCGAIGPLNPHWRCGSCDSDALISAHKLGKEAVANGNPKTTTC